MNVAKQKAYHRKWYQKNKQRLRPYKREMMRRLRKANPKKYAEQARDAKRRLRQQILDVFGRVCSCGFEDVRALTLDHKLDNGSSERKRIGERGVYRRALLPRNRNEYQILCMNCQFIKRSSG
jgi:hypothetical protein